MNHRIPTVTLVAAALLVSATAHADDNTLAGDVRVDAPYDDYTVGVGAMIGDPTAVGLKTRFDENNALQFHAGWGFADPYGARATFMLDYLAHIVVFAAETRDVGLLTPYVGLGGKLGLRESDDPVAIGARVPLGLGFLFREVPIEVFLEIAPGVLVFPEVAALVDGGVGARVYF
ncbi:MAG: hypothetical protein RMA76_10195 [Deltaproteobacteria bacterium]|jgi:hypothetical protein